MSPICIIYTQLVVDYAKGAYVYDLTGRKTYDALGGVLADGERVPSGYNS